MRLPEHKHFFAVHGKKAETLSDLRDMIVSIPEKDFIHHIKEKNDFAVWVRDILHKDYLAERMEKVSSREDLLELITDEMIKDRESELSGSDEFKRFIAREFIYGMLLGIVLGLVISQLI
ncbi:MAG: hypothetical protein KKF89_05980 [Nanoarchaeota archaeon]|nr:hypothetical protein [Nanoarchaeota archaeon]MBU1855247.1 hypothetical protein [Nanoarchaeota archaeon]